VKDSGIGIRNEDLLYIFDRFYQAKKTDDNLIEGTGIGLAIVKEYVNLMHGSIKVESTLNKGTVFIIKIPITQKASKENLLKIKSKEQTLAKLDQNLIIETNPNEPIILIVEDNYDVANYIASSINIKFQIIMSKDGEEGINKAFEIIPDLIITDLMMPKKDGFELCEILKKDIKTSHIPIIMLTARSLEQDKLKGYKVGADAYLVKPFNKRELNIRIEQLIELRLNLQKKYCDSAKTIKQAKTTEDKFILKLFSVLEHHLNESDFKSVNLASQINLSESQLYRKIKALTNKSTAIFIRDYRLEKAKERLADKNLNVSEIAYDCGFGDPSVFSKNFKEKYGMSPGEYRKRVNS
jgi:DNA-binding response OmpR family regulator